MPKTLRVGTTRRVGTAPKKVKTFVGMLLGGKAIVGIDDRVLDGKTFHSVSLSDGTTTTLSKEDLLAQVK